MVEPVPTENESMRFLSTPSMSDDKEREVLCRLRSVCTLQTESRRIRLRRCTDSSSSSQLLECISSIFANNRLMN
jgi:hypothetical protein